MAITDILTPDTLRALCSGVDFYDNRDELLVSDEAFELQLDMAVSQVETETGLSLRGAVGDSVVQELDVQDWDPQRWYLNRLPRRPILQINGIKLQYSNYPAWEFPKDWLRIRNPNQGEVQLLPGAGNIRYLQGPLVQYAFLQRNSMTPAYLHIDYDYGFEQVVGTLSTIEDSVDATLTLTEGTLSQKVQPGDWLILNDSAYAVRRVRNPTSVTLRTPASTTESGDVILAKYDATMFAAVSSLALIPLLEQLGLRLRPPGMVGQRVSIDALAQGSNYNPRGPFAAMIEQQRERHKQAMAAILNKWGRVNLLVM